MNRYPLWVYVTIAVALALGALYTLPNFFGEAPAVQVSPARATLKVDNAVLGRVEEALKKAGVQPTGVFLDLASIKESLRLGARIARFLPRRRRGWRLRLRRRAMVAHQQTSKPRIRGPSPHGVLDYQW